MPRNKPVGVKLKLIKKVKQRSAPRWADIKKFGLKRARGRRIKSVRRQWRRDRIKI